MLAAGDVADARQTFEASVAAMRKAAVADPDSEAAARDLALELGKLSFAIRTQNDPLSADAPAAEALGISRRLVLAHPGSPNAQADLVFALGRYGDLRFAQHDAVGAGAAYAEALRIAKALARAQPAAITLARSVGELSAKLANTPGAGPGPAR
ncbi:MAG: hypothetical protein WDM85_00175 [Caulobacteraceae bacterium]